MPRRRIGDGPSPSLLGQILLTLVEGDAGTYYGDGAAVTAAQLAGKLQMPPAQLRASAGELVRARCLHVGRAPTTRHGDSGRYAQTFSLAPESDERGPARRPRLCPVGLIVEPDAGVAARVGTALRHAGMLPVAVASAREALAVLAHLGFELVIVDHDALAAVPASYVARLREAVRQSGCGPVLLLGPEAAAGTIAGDVGAAGFVAGSADPMGLRSALGDALHSARRDTDAALMMPVEGPGRFEPVPFFD